MKKILLAALIVFTYHLATAQLQADRVIVGFGLDFTEINVASSDIFAVRLQEKQYQLNIGYALTPKLAIGLEFNRSEKEDTERLFFNRFSLNSVGRYYLLNTKRFGLYGEGIAGFGHLEVVVPSLVIDNNFNFLTYGAGAGLQFNISPHIALDLNARYTGREDFIRSELEDQGWSFRTGLQFNFSLKK